MSHDILDRMVKKGNNVAQLRRSELEHLEQLLGPVRRQKDTDKSLAHDTGESINVFQRQPAISSNNDPPIQSNDFDVSGIGISWDALFGSAPVAANHEDLLSLAEQFDMEDFSSNLFY